VRGISFEPMSFWHHVLSNLNKFHYSNDRRERESCVVVYAGYLVHARNCMGKDAMLFEYIFKLN
jgi:hypothetical protein